MSSLSVSTCRLRSFLTSSAAIATGLFFKCKTCQNILLGFINCRDKKPTAQLRPITHVDIPRHSLCRRPSCSQSLIHLAIERTSAVCPFFLENLQSFLNLLSHLHRFIPDSRWIFPGYFPGNVKNVRANSGVFDQDRSLKATPRMLDSSHKRHVNTKPNNGPITIYISTRGNNSLVTPRESPCFLPQS